MFLILCIKISLANFLFLTSGLLRYSRAARQPSYEAKTLPFKAWPSSEGYKGGSDQMV